MKTGKQGAIPLQTLVSLDSADIFPNSDFAASLQKWHEENKLGKSNQCETNRESCSERSSFAQDLHQDSQGRWRSCPGEASVRTASPCSIMRFALRSLHARQADCIDSVPRPNHRSTSEQSTPSDQAASHIQHQHISAEAAVHDQTKNAHPEAAVSEHSQNPHPGQATAMEAGIRRRETQALCLTKYAEKAGISAQQPV